MGDNITEIDAAKAKAESMTNPGTFSIAERLSNRGLPEEDVPVYLDEKAGWELIRLEEKHADAASDEEAVEIEAKMAKVRAKLASSRYLFTVRGMTNETYDKLIDQVEEEYPKEFTEEFNPLTGGKSKVLIPNEGRDERFNLLFLAESIAKITDPDGAVDSNIDDVAMAFIRNQAPLDALDRIMRMATRMRMASEWMEQLEDEDFSPKP